MPPPNPLTNPSAWDTVILGGRTLPGVARVTIAPASKLSERGANGRNGRRVTHRGAESTKVTIELQMWSAEQMDSWLSMAPALMARDARAMAALRRANAAATQAGAAQKAARTGDPSKSISKAIAVPRVVVSPDGTRNILDGLDITASTRAATNNAQRDARRAQGASATDDDRQPLDIRHPACAQFSVTHVHIKDIQQPPPDAREGFRVTLQCTEVVPPARAASRSTTAAPSPRGGAADVPVAAPFRVSSGASQP